jgi:hypothetical protein
MSCHGWLSLQDTYTRSGRDRTPRDCRAPSTSGRVGERRTSDATNIMEASGVGQPQQQEPIARDAASVAHAAQLLNQLLCLCKIRATMEARRTKIHHTM